MTTPLHEQLRDAADACTPSPLQDLLRRAADAVEVKQTPALKVHKGEICYKSDADDQSYGMWCPVCYGTQHKYKEGAEFYTHPAPTPDGMMLVPDGWKIVEKEFGVILVEHPEIGGVLVDPCDRKNPIAADILHALAEAMLKAAGESS